LLGAVGMDAPVFIVKNLLLAVAQMAAMADVAVA
jgi:hypothetical protein